MKLCQMKPSQMKDLSKPSWKLSAILLALATMAVCLAPMSSQAAQATSKGIGLGFVLGDPTGLSGRMWQGPSNAIDITVGFSFGGENLMVMGNYLWLNNDLIPIPSGKMPLYYGPGAAVYFSDNPALGLNVKVGLAYLLADAPLDFFIEIGPELVIGSSMDGSAIAGLGARFYF